MRTASFVPAVFLLCLYVCTLRLVSVAAQTQYNFCSVLSGLNSAWTAVTNGSLTLAASGQASSISGARTVYDKASGSTYTAAITALLPPGSQQGGLSSANGGRFNASGNDNLLFPSASSSGTGAGFLSPAGLAFSLSSPLPLPTTAASSLVYVAVSNVLLFNAVQPAEAGGNSTASGAAVVQAWSAAYASFSLSTGAVSCPAASSFFIPASAAPSTQYFCSQFVSGSQGWSVATSGQLVTTAPSTASTDPDYMLGGAVTVLSLSGSRSFYSASTGSVQSNITGILNPRSFVNAQSYPNNNLLAARGSNSGWLDRAGVTFTVSPATYLGPSYTAPTSPPSSTSVVNVYAITGVLESAALGSAQPVADLSYFTVSSSALSCPVIAPSSVGTLQWSWTYSATAASNSWTVQASGFLITTNITQPVADFGSGTFEGGLPYPSLGYKLLGITGTRIVTDTANTTGFGVNFVSSSQICGVVPTSLGDEQPDNLLFYPAPVSSVLLSQAGIGYFLSSPSILPLVVAETISDVNLFYMNSTSPYAAPGQTSNEYAEANGVVEPAAPFEPLTSSFSISPTSAASVSSACTSLGATSAGNGTASSTGGYSSAAMPVVRRADAVVGASMAVLLTGLLALLI